MSMRLEPWTDAAKESRVTIDPLKKLRLGLKLLVLATFALVRVQAYDITALNQRSFLPLFR